MQGTAAAPDGAGRSEHGLKANAINYVSSVVIGVASTAPGYSLAAVLGFIVAIAGVGVQAPAVMIVSFIPMLLIAAAYYYLNRADPDCGTTFSWVTKALRARRPGWIGGWAIVVADIIVMANLAEIAGLYTFLPGRHRRVDRPWVDRRRRASGSPLMTWICVIGIELNAARSTSCSPPSS